METLQKINDIIPIHWLLGMLFAGLFWVVKFQFNLWDRQRDLEKSVNDNYAKDAERHDALKGKIDDLKANYVDLDSELSEQRKILIELRMMVKLLVDNRISLRNGSINEKGEISI